MSDPGPHVVLVARLVGSSKLKASGTERALKRIRAHHQLLREVVEEAFRAGTQRPHIFGTCDDDALLLAEVDAAATVADAALDFVAAVEAHEAELATQLGLAVGVEHWTPGKPWMPEIFAEAANTALQLAAIAGPGQLVAMEALQPLAGASLSWGDPLEARIEGSRDAAVAVAEVSRGTPKLVWHVDALREDLAAFAGMTRASAEIAETIAVSSTLVQKLQDSGALSTLERKLGHLVSDDEPGPLVRLKEHFAETPQLNRLTTLAPNVDQLVASATAMKEEYANRRSAFFEPSDTQDFKEAAHACEVCAVELVEGARDLHRKVFRLLRSREELDREIQELSR